MTDRNGPAESIGERDGDGAAFDTGALDARAVADDTDIDTAVRLADVRKTYHLGEPVHALDGVSFAVPSGSYTAVMGPSGSGKSTLMNLVGCLDTPTEGVVEVGGEDVSTLSADGKATLRGEQVGFVFQTFNLMPRLTATENVALPMVFRGRPRSERTERARALLSQVGLGDRLDHHPTELSGGQRQRVAIARALANDPEIILADEPTGNLDTETGGEILGLFQRLHDAGNTILLVTHERQVAEHANRIVHLLDGKLDEIETVDTPRRVAETETEAVAVDGGIDSDDQGDPDAATGGDEGGSHGEFDFGTDSKTPASGDLPSDSETEVDTDSTDGTH